MPSPPLRGATPIGSRKFLERLRSLSRQRSVGNQLTHAQLATEAEKARIALKLASETLRSSDRAVAQLPEVVLFQYRKRKYKQE